MVIFDTHQKIDAIRKVLPEGFVFVLDTTDRSFVYKSLVSSDCEQKIISLDKMQGIDKLTKTSNYYKQEDEEGMIKLLRIGENTYIGFCAPESKFSESQWKLADNLLNELSLSA